MTTDRRYGSWFTEEQAMLVFVVISVVLAALVILPYVQFVLLAMVFAYILWPARERLNRHLRREVTALLLTAVSIVAVFLPVAYLLFAASRQAVRIIESISAGDLDIAALERQLAELGLNIDFVGFYGTYNEQIAAAMERVVWSVFDMVRSIPNLFIGLIITVFVLFVLLRDGDRLAAWIRSILPIRDDVQDEFNARLDRLMRASVIGNVFASFIQAIGLGVGLWLLGFDNIIFLTVLTFILALLPLVGAFLVWVPLVFYLFAVGEPTSGAILLVYGMIISMSDFYTRPMVIGYSAALNSAIIVLGVFGGIVAFGAIGLLVGPVILGGAKIAVEVLVRERNNHLKATSP